ncbi:mitochondrial ribosome-associated GTPase 1 [Rana temporaria]|uniref:mitochondrial ribosome-associated GTPase 1 n=1 Tax=Rana temporaria TaxID=8407 RepID=UPI001AAD9FCD|nr:mitochondrial ribosome-associated GTPase 1 [Rana temporaria]XP_040176702.1 mitochondrial ribosome-associated GTPase 1 [Rana temporaria]
MRLSSVLRFPYDFGGRDVAHWFPGHMAKGMKQMRAKLTKVDCIVEVHDARIPLSGRNPFFKEHLGIKPHLLILNKLDLADLTHQNRIITQLRKQEVGKVIYTDCIREENVRKIVPAITERIECHPRFNRAENPEICIMVTGIPNVGKSSLINALRRIHLRKGKASRVGGEPGITRSVLCKIQVSENPLIYLLDTPGVLSPRIENVETGMKLALCGTILDHLVGEEMIADYLLYTLNNYAQHSYVQHYELEGPCDDIETLLKKIAKKLGKTQVVKAITGTGNVNITIPNYSAAAYDFIRAFRKGDLGRVTLD